MKKKGVTAMLHSLNAGYHTSSILRTLKREQIKLNTLKRQRIMQNGKFDKRRRYFLIIDDTAVRRYGRSVYGSGYNHSGNAGKVIWSNCLVTFQLREKRALDNDFRLYLPRKYVQKHPSEVFKKKTQLAVEILEEKLRLYGWRMHENMITLLADASYAVERVLSFAREKRISYVGRLKKDRHVRLFSKWVRVEEYFRRYKEERYFTCEGKRVFYKEAVLHVKELGRLKVFRFREEESEPRYYVTNKLKMTAKTCYEYKKLRWKIEEMHRELKQYLGLENTCAWKKESLIAHYRFVFLLWWLFEKFRAEQRLKVSFEALWWEYCADVERTKWQRAALEKPPPVTAFSYV